MIVEIIYNFLQTNKRLVVPNLGAFIVKQGQDGQRKVLFSNLIKGDDGVLRALLIEKGVSELEAQGVIDRFVFEVNHRLDLGNVCALDGFGALKRGANGAMSFVENEGAKGEVLDGNFGERLAERNAKRAAEVKQPELTPAPEPEEDDNEELTIEVVPQSVEPEPVRPARRPVQEQAPIGELKENIWSVGSSKVIPSASNWVLNEKSCVLPSEV